VRVAPEVPFEASHEPGMLTVVFGEQPAPELRGPVTPDLYRRLFPTGAEGAAPSGEEERFDRGGAEGLAVGPVTLRPYVSASWVDADVLAFDSPTPVRDQYLQVAPGVTASVPVRDGLLAAEYDGLEWHSHPDQVAHDRARREMLEREFGWLIIVVDRTNLFGSEQNCEALLRSGLAQARRRLGSRLV